MAINKKLIHFTLKSNFEKEKKNILPTSIVFIQDTQEIYTHGKFYKCDISQSEVNQLIESAKNSQTLTAAEFKNGILLTLNGTKSVSLLPVTETTAGLMTPTDKVQMNTVSSFLSSDTEYVDLGLPSGNKWATCNIGASEPTQVGKYFQWGELEGLEANDPNFSDVTSWSAYKFADTAVGSNTVSITKYNSIDNLTELEVADDIAHIDLGGYWRIPSKQDWEELVTHTNVFLQLLDGTVIPRTTIVGGTMPNGWNWGEVSRPSAILGIRFEHFNDPFKYILIPPCGMGISGTVQFKGQYDYLWARTLNSNEDKEAHTFGFNMSSLYLENPQARNTGLPIRGIVVPKLEGSKTIFTEPQVKRVVEEVVPEISDMQSQIQQNFVLIGTAYDNIQNHTTRLNNLENSDFLTKSEADDIYATPDDIQQVKSEILGDDLTDTFDTLKAVQDWADEHGTEYAQLVTTVSNKADRSELPTKMSQLQNDSDFTPGPILGQLLDEKVPKTDLLKISDFPDPNTAVFEPPFEDRVLTAGAYNIMSNNTYGTKDQIKTINTTIKSLSTSKVSKDSILYYTDIQEDPSTAFAPENDTMIPAAKVTSTMAQTIGDQIFSQAMTNVYNTSTYTLHAVVDSSNVVTSLHYSAGDKPNQYCLNSDKFDVTIIVQGVEIPTAHINTTISGNYVTKVYAFNYSGNYYEVSFGLINSTTGAITTPTLTKKKTLSQLLPLLSVNFYEISLASNEYHPFEDAKVYNYTVDFSKIIYFSNINTFGLLGHDSDGEYYILGDFPGGHRFGRSYSISDPDTRPYVNQLYYCTKNKTYYIGTSTGLEVYIP